MPRFNTQPPEGGWVPPRFGGARRHRVSTHSRPKAAGSLPPKACLPMWFQHTAARRRLGGRKMWIIFILLVSTHSRPKAAGAPEQRQRFHKRVSTHSRPKAAGPPPSPSYRHPAFQHTAARRRLGQGFERRRCLMQFQHTAARRRLEPLSKALLHQVSQPRFR